MRTLSYGEAICEALRQKMEEDDRVFVIGQGVRNPWYVGNSMRDLDKIFGHDRIIDPPICENGMNGFAIGAALAGMRPIALHPRMDFLVVGLDQVINEAANWHYMFGGRVHVPIVIRAIINRGGEQAAQHSQALQAIFMHVPGLKVVMPATPYDAKGLLIASIEDDNPVIYIDDRWLYNVEGDVPEEMYRVPIGKGALRREGKDVTLLATSYMVLEATKATEALEQQGIDAELIDVRSIKPLDEDLIFSSVAKTGRLVIADAAWRTCGVAAEIAARVVESAFEKLKAPIMRVTLPDAPAPASSVLERKYYPRSEDIVATVKRVMAWKES